jgi:radical SAM family uncharacterized protein
MSLQKDIEEKLLQFVQGPSQYIGREMNRVRKEWNQCDIHIALGFPDTYKIGTSSLAMQIIYFLLNGMDGVVCERVFCPWIDASDRMRAVGIPLFSLETYRPIREFDIFAVSVPYEMLYTNVLEMLDLAGIGVWSRERKETDPLILTGGSQMHNPEPFADFIDAAIIGEAEATLPVFIEAFRELKKQNLPRLELLKALADRLEWVYVPQLYSCEYNEDNTIKSLQGRPVRREIVKDLDEAPYPTRPIVPFHETIHDRINIEIMRGCPHSCRFCHEGYTRKPVRRRSPEKIFQIAKETFANTGIPEISLCSLSSADYPGLEDLFMQMNDYFAPQHVSIALPSLRVQDQLKMIPSQTSMVRKTPLTIALEAGTPRLRDVIGKNIDMANLKPAVMEAYKCGWRQVKLYFMAGMPGETDEDLYAIVDQANEIAQWRKEIAGRPASINASISFMVPKPQTPLQWLGQAKMEYYERAINLVRQEARRYPHIKITWHDRFRSRLEAVLARGDRRLSQVLYLAWKDGARFDSWDDTFQYQRYAKAFETAGISSDFYANRNIGPKEILPWDHIRVGFEKDFLFRHLHIALEKLPDLGTLYQ